VVTVCRPGAELGVTQSAARISLVLGVTVVVASGAALTHTEQVERGLRWLVDLDEEIL